VWSSRTAGNGNYRGRHSAEAALAMLELFDGGIQVGLIEIGPHAIGEQQFGVGRLLEQKVGQALLAAGAYQQVDIAGIAADGAHQFEPQFVA
jgi:hypothetical protein